MTTEELTEKIEIFYKECFQVELADEDVAGFTA